MPSMSSWKFAVWFLALPKTVVSKTIVVFTVRGICLKVQRRVVLGFSPVSRDCIDCYMLNSGISWSSFSSTTHGWVKPGGELDDNISRGNYQWTKIERRQGGLGFSSRIFKEAKLHSPVVFSKYSPESQLFTSNQCCNSWKL